MPPYLWLPATGDMLALSKDFPGLSPPRGVHFHGDSWGRIVATVNGRERGFVSFRWACQRWMEV